MRQRQALGSILETRSCVYRCKGYATRLVTVAESNLILNMILADLETKGKKWLVPGGTTQREKRREREREREGAGTCPGVVPCA